MSGALDIAPAIVWAAGISTLLSLATTIWSYLTSGAKKNDTRIADLTCRIEEAEKASEKRIADLERHAQNKVAELERRMQRTEDRLSATPSVEMMHRLELSLSTMDGELGKINERLKPVAAIAERMQELLLAQGRNG